MRKARDKVYHCQCFTCSMCSKKLETGEVLYLGSDTLLCKEDYLKTGGNSGKKKKKKLNFSSPRKVQKSSSSSFDEDEWPRFRPSAGPN